MNYFQKTMVLQYLNNKLQNRLINLYLRKMKKGIDMEKISHLRSLRSSPLSKKQIHGVLLHLSDEELNLPDITEVVGDDVEVNEGTKDNVYKTYKQLGFKVNRNQI